MTRRIELRDGSAVELRPITPDDRAELAQAFARLSPESRYRRFFSPVTNLTERQLDYLTEVDHHDHEALLAVDPAGGTVAVARYVRTGPGVAEPAIVVTDDWQRRGLASVLLDALADRAREEGIETFVAPVLAENTAAIKLLERLGDGDATTRRDGTEVELAIPLGAQQGAAPSLRRVLAAVAEGSARPALTFWQRVATSSEPASAQSNAVVVGVPRPEAVERVVEAAAAAARATGAEVRVIGAQRFLLDDREEMAARMRAVELRLHAHGLDVSTQARRGDLAASLIREAVSCGALLIVVDGTEPHASTPLLGSTWDHVTHHAPCNVLIAR